MLFRLIYISASKTLLGAAGIAALLAHARRGNAAAGITGILLYHDGGFFQVLEGPRAPVERLFAAIRADPRHHSVIMLWQGPVDTRLFGDWRMGFVPPADLPATDLPHTDLPHTDLPVTNLSATDLSALAEGGLSPRQLMRSSAPWNTDRITGPLLRRFLRSYRDFSF